MFPTFERFKYYMDKVIAYDNAVDEIWDVINEAVIDKLSVAQSGLIEVLEELTGDEETGWIGYWLYELDQGNEYEEGMITVDDVPVPLETLEDLYNILRDNVRRRAEEHNESFVGVS